MIDRSLINSIKPIIYCLIPLLFIAVGFKRNLVWRDAITLWQDVAKKSYLGNARAHNAIGLAYFEKGDMDAAINQFVVALKVEPDASHILKSQVYNNLGVMYKYKGFDDRAEFAWEEALRFRHDNPEANENLGLLYFEKGMIKDAVQRFETALRLKKDSARLYNEAGATYLKNNMLDKAILSFKSAIRLEHGFVTAYVNLGFAYFEKGDYDKAVEMHEKAVSMMPNFANAHYGLAAVYEKKGMIDKAVRHYKEYIRYADSKEKFVEKARRKIYELDKN